MSFDTIFTLILRSEVIKYSKKMLLAKNLLSPYQKKFFFLLWNTSPNQNFDLATPLITGRGCPGMRCGEKRRQSSPRTKGATQIQNIFWNIRKSFPKIRVASYFPKNTKILQPKNLIYANSKTLLSPLTILHKQPDSQDSGTM